MKMKEFFLNELLKTNVFDNFDDIFSACNALYCDECCGKCDDESLNKEVEYDKCNEKGKKTGTPTIAERLKEVCQTKKADKDLEDAFNHVKNAVLEAIEGDFSHNAKYAELIPNKGICFTNDPIICAISSTDKCLEFHKRITGELGFKTLMTYFDKTNKIAKIGLYY